MQPERIVIDGPVGPLEGLLEAPPADAAAVAVVCHPHPLHGGTMTNKVAHTLARTFRRAGAAAVRFNFRGVGQSAGTHDDGAGEIDDAVAAAQWARTAYPNVPLYLAGFSFGARVALLAAPRLEPAGLVTVAPPVEKIPADFARPDCPWLIVHGEQDELVPLDDVRAWVASVGAAASLTVIDGASHFFHGALTVLSERVDSFYRRAAAGRGGAANAAGQADSASPHRPPAAEKG